MQLYKTFIILSFMLLCVCNKITAQSVPIRLKLYDEKTIHFGWFIGGNSLSTNIKDKKILPAFDSIMGFNAQRQVGFQLGVLVDFRLNSYFNLRLEPNVCFNQRKIDFYVNNNDINHINSNANDIVYLIMPMDLKVRSKRYNNFRPYLTLGMMYAFDISSIKRKKFNDDEFLYKINDHEIFYSLGVGFDFYLSFFKFAVEIKSASALNNILNKDFHTPFEQTIDKLTSQMVIINFTFE